MHLRYCNKCSKYTLKDNCCEATTRSAHPAHFTPEDKYSKHRIEIKKRYNLLPTQLPEKPL